MEVISKVNTRKILKDQIYKVVRLNNDPTCDSKKDTDLYGSYGWIEISLNNLQLGRYKLSYFKPLDSEEFSIKTYQDPLLLKRSRVNFDAKITDLKVNDIVECINDSRYKYLVKGGKYRISEIDYGRDQFKLEGYDKWLVWTYWTFNILPLEESRRIKLDEIFNKPQFFGVEFKRKIEKKGNKNKLLIELLSKSISDRFRHSLSTVDWCIEKQGKVFDINKDDFNEILNMPLKDVLSIVD